MSSTITTLLGAAEDLSSAEGATTTTSLMDEATVVHFYRTHAPAIFTHCRRLLRSTVAARDATQETFIRMLAKAPRHLDQDNLLRYLYRISTNICLNHLREERVLLQALRNLQSRNCHPSQDSGIADRDFAAQLLERCDELGAAIAVMHHIDGLSQIEIAETLQVTRRTVYNRLRRIEALARTLRDR